MVVSRLIGAAVPGIFEIHCVNRDTYLRSSIFMDALGMNANWVSHSSSWSSIPHSSQCIETGDWTFYISKVESESIEGFLRSRQCRNTCYRSRTDPRTLVSVGTVLHSRSYLCCLENSLRSETHHSPGCTKGKCRRLSRRSGTKP